MRTHLKLPTLAIVVILVIAACSSSTSSSAPSAAVAAPRLRQRRRAPPATARRLRARQRRRGGPDAGARQGLCPEHRRERDADVGALRRQQGDGRHPRLRLERGEPDQADQPELHRPHGDGGEDRPGRRVGRRPGPDGHGPDLCPAVRERRSAGRHHRSVQGLAGAGRRQPGSQDRRDIQRPAVRRPAVRRRVGAVLQQGPVQEGRAGSEQAADQPRRDPGLRRQDHRARRRRHGLLPARQLRRLQHLHRRPADVGVGCDDRGQQVR